MIHHGPKGIFVFILKNIFIAVRLATRRPRITGAIFRGPLSNNRGGGRSTTGIGQGRGVVYHGPHCSHFLLNGTDSLTFFGRIFLQLIVTGEGGGNRVLSKVLQGLVQDHLGLVNGFTHATGHLIHFVG